MALNQPQQTNEWYFDSGATSHRASHSDILTHSSPMRYPTPTSIIVGSELANRNKILNKLWGNQNIIKMQGGMKNISAGRSDR